MSDHSRTIRTAAGIILIAVAAGMTVLPSGVQVLKKEQRKYLILRSAGRIPEAPEIRMPNGSIGINDAELDELCELYGIGETLSTMIIRERDENGRFYFPEDLTHVKGIGPAKLQGFRESINLE